MNRLPITLPEWTRPPMWVSARAEAVWRPRLEAARAAWPAVERASVVAGVRTSALQTCAIEQLSTLTQEMAAHGLIVLPLKLEPRALRYTSRDLPETPVLDYRIAITRPEFAAEWLRAWAAHDDDHIGALLGIPPCCRAFFARVWRQEGWIDTTWPMLSSAGVEGPPEVNVLLRWVGVRLVPHLPCSFSCAASQRLSADMVRAGEAVGHREALGWAREMLSWPMLWSALHGILELTTPVFKVSASTDVTTDKVEVQRPGDRMPDEAPRGLSFPFNQVPIRPIPLAFRRAFDSWSDNGFKTREAMAAAHAIVAQAVPADASSLLDLGCGNGALLRRVRPSAECRLLGVDRSTSKIAAAAAADPEGRYEAGDLWQLLAGLRADVALLYPGRILEQPVERRVDLVELLALRVARLVVYAYDDSMRMGNVLELAQQAGLFDRFRQQGPMYGTPQTQAALLVRRS